MVVVVSFTGGASVVTDGDILGWLARMTVRRAGLHLAGFDTHTQGYANAKAKRFYVDHGGPDIITANLTRGDRGVMVSMLNTATEAYCLTFKDRGAGAEWLSRDVYSRFPEEAAMLGGAFLKATRLQAEKFLKQDNRLGIEWMRAQNFPVRFEPFATWTNPIDQFGELQHRDWWQINVKKPERAIVWRNEYYPVELNLFECMVAAQNEPIYAVAVPVWVAQTGRYAAAIAYGSKAEYAHALAQDRAQDRDADPGDYRHWAIRDGVLSLYTWAVDLYNAVDERSAAGK